MRANASCISLTEVDSPRFRWCHSALKSNSMSKTTHSLFSALGNGGAWTRDKRRSTCCSKAVINLLCTLGSFSKATSEYNFMVCALSGAHESFPLWCECTCHVSGKTRTRGIDTAAAYSNCHT